MTIKPAANERHWRMFELQAAGKMIGGAQSPCTDAVEEAEDRGQRHMLAAFALHGQPFGFTREDVRRLREFSDACNAGQDNVEKSGAWAAWASDLAARIEALLPRELGPER